jgi:hypothetical protein
MMKNIPCRKKPNVFLNAHPLRCAANRTARTYIHTPRDSLFARLAFEHPAFKYGTSF